MKQINEKSVWVGECGGGEEIVMLNMFEFVF